jgi:hypothetical protein
VVCCGQPSPGHLERRAVGLADFLRFVAHSGDMMVTQEVAVFLGVRCPKHTAFLAVPDAVGAIRCTLYL